ncbi:MAG: MATE family efflux transporter [Burkholderiales bacterium]|nr:MATE family efflux transporter [Burkholderiales bacterium]
MTTMAAPGSGAHDLLHGPLLATLFRLATPNVLGLFATTVVIGYDGYILGRLGADALAGVALVLPLSMLMLQMSAGGIGGAVTAAVARALGAGKRDEAGRLALHGLLIGLVLAGIFALVMLGWGKEIYSAMGGKGAALDAALAYSAVLFGGSLVTWWLNVLGAIVRGSGNMVLPSAMMATTALIHLATCPLLVFGLGSVSGFGVVGAAISTLATGSLSVVVMFIHLMRGEGPVRLSLGNWSFSQASLNAILRVGAPASLSPIFSNGSIAATTALIGAYGTAALAGYGVAARLEYIMVPIAFGFGTVLTTLVATNIGAGHHERALHATWTGGGVVALITGAIGIGAAVMPGLWMNLFSTDAAVVAFGTDYLHVVGACYGLFGLGLALFFASQGAGRMFWPLAGSVARLVAIAGGGWIVVHWLHAAATALFVVIAISFAVYALIIGGAIRLGSWVRS